MRWRNGNVGLSFFLFVGCQKEKRAQIRSVIQIPSQNPQTWNSLEGLSKDEEGVTYNVVEYQFKKC